MKDTERFSFTYSDYNELLDCIVDSGYSFSFFERNNNDENVVFLRHDVDKSIKKAFEVAKIECKKNIVSTYFFLTRSPLYSVLEPDTMKTIREIHMMGHRIGLHIDLSRIKEVSNSSIDPNNLINNEFHIMQSAIGNILKKNFSFHNPTEDLLKFSTFNDEFTCTYDDNFMLPNTKYLSDSNSFWREGNPLENIKNKRWKRLQILTHPIWWTQERPESIIKILKNTISDRRIELDSYLKNSNSVYANSFKDK